MINPTTILNQQHRKHRPDYVLFILSMILISLGLVVVYAISPALLNQATRSGKTVGENYFVIKQASAILLGLIAFIITSKIPINKWGAFRWPLIIISTLASFAVFLTGNVNGASRWIQIGGLSFQPSEMVKFTIVIVASFFLSNQLRLGLINDEKKTLRPYLIGIVITGIIVAGLQSDLGSTGVMIGIMGVLLLIAGVPLKRLGILCLLLALAVTLVVALTPYRRDRFFTFMHPEKDCQSTGYHACQALIAVGSGGVAGLGLGRSVQAYGYLPEAANDSVFAVYAEYFGFIGSVVLLAIYGFLLSRIIKIARCSPDTTTRFIVVGIFAWLLSQSVINIGAMIGLLPLKGITLPFISYGGTSIVFVMSGMGLVFQASRSTTTRAVYLSSSDNQAQISGAANIRRHK